MLQSCYFAIQQTNENEFCAYDFGSVYETFVNNAKLLTSLFHKLKPYDQLRFVQRKGVCISKKYQIEQQQRMTKYKRRNKDEAIEFLFKKQNDTKFQQTQNPQSQVYFKSTNSSTIEQLKKYKNRQQTNKTMSQIRKSQKKF
ncbi:unnamed protein product [Paramecium octaurelia]|uniref:Uncharacterized protein n=1 Tax=Paramecium octaurelia TaxID=43137 RepID=A0A8S1TRT9_PAROT|nr:unnamed protein product [Paramecium octaurelia]